MLQSLNTCLMTVETFFYFFKCSIALSLKSILKLHDWSTDLRCKEYNETCFIGHTNCRQKLTVTFYSVKIRKRQIENMYGISCTCKTPKCNSHSKVRWSVPKCDGLSTVWTLKYNGHAKMWWCFLLYILHMLYILVYWHSSDPVIGEGQMKNQICYVWTVVIFVL
jgi:hypothetical protein